MPMIDPAPVRLLVDRLATALTDPNDPLTPIPTDTILAALAVFAGLLFVAFKVNPADFLPVLEACTVKARQGLSGDA